MKTAWLLSFFLLQCGCSDRGGQDRSDAQTTALKTCNTYLKSRVNAKSVAIPSNAVAFTIRGDGIVVRWPFQDGQVTKIGTCTTSPDGKTFRFAEALPTKI